MCVCPLTLSASSRWVRLSSWIKGKSLCPQVCFLKTLNKVTRIVHGNCSDTEILKTCLSIPCGLTVVMALADREHK